MPSRLATSTTLSAPTDCSSGTKNVLTELPKPVHMLNGPDSLLLEFVGHQWPLLHSDGSLRPTRYCDTNGFCVSITVANGYPASSAAIAVNILNVEPA